MKRIIALLVLLVIQLEISYLRLCLVADNLQLSITTNSSNTKLQDIMIKSIENKSKDKTLDSRNNICWILGVVMFVIGVLNIIEVHVIPGAFYILFAAILIPVSDVFSKKYLGFNIPFRVKVVLFILVMWGILGLEILRRYMVYKK